MILSLFLRGGRRVSLPELSSSDYGSHGGWVVKVRWRPGASAVNFSAAIFPESHSALAATRAMV